MLNLSNHYLTKLPDSMANLTDFLTELDLSHNHLANFPESISNFVKLTHLNLSGNKLINLPECISKLSILDSLNLSGNRLSSLPEDIRSLSKLTSLLLSGNQLNNLPNDIGYLLHLAFLGLSYNQLTSLPNDIGKLSNLTILHLGDNQLTSLPKDIGNLTNLSHLYLQNNQITSLPESFSNLANLIHLSLDNNPLVDLSSIQNLKNLESVNFFNIDLPRRYWTKFSEWEFEWLLDEHNTEIRRILIEQVGYEKICDKLSAVTLDIWREYTLLKIDDVEISEYDEDGNFFEAEAMVLLKMACPSTQHIHILRVPPEMTSAEAAITWVNHGIHPDEFAVQT